MAGENKAKTFYDFIGAFDAGVNMGIEPLLVPKNQLCEGHNISVRGAYVTHRPPHLKAEFIWPDIPTQTAFEQGLYQGGGYYRPDFGTSQLIVSISGHIYSLTETGGKFVVADISIAGDLNDASQHQVWMWQEEKWLIISDGTGALPIFWDGVSCRRSYGPSVVLATATPSGNFPNPRAIGESLTINLAAIYSGPYNIPVIFNGSFYEISGVTAGGFNAILTNVDDTPANVVPSGTDVIVKTGTSGTVTTGATSFIQGLSYAPAIHTLTLVLNSVASIVVGDSIAIPSVIIGGQGADGGGKIVSIDIPSSTVVVNWTVNPSGYPPATFDTSVTINNGSAFTTSSTTPTVVLGTTTANFTVPAVGATVDVTLDIPYTGPANQACELNGKKYIINPVVIGPSNIITLINRTDLTDAGQAIPNGSPGGDILSVPEIPACRMGAYGMGRGAFSNVDAISFDYTDIVGGAAGTAANDFRDSVLKMTESTFQSGGGSFRLPGSGDIITSMVFGANLDVALGQGPLQVGTAASIFTCQVGFDRTTWASTTNPILTEALIGNGPQGQWSTTLVNSDVFFRSSEGAASLVQARRDFYSWGNVPISQEMKPVYDADNQTLLQYGSKVDFDNRALETSNPVTSAQGVFHDKLVSMSFDTISNLRTKLPPVYEGTWEGLNVFQTITGNINGSNRCFAFVLNTATNKIELYELLRQSTASIYDNDTDRITFQFDSPILFNKDIKGINELIKLDDGEIYTKDIQGAVDVEVQYRPDFNPLWTSWHKWTMDSSTWKPRIGLGEPDSKVCEVGGERQMKVGYFFQLRIIITGHIKFMGLRAAASTQPETQFAKPICTT